MKTASEKQANYINHLTYILYKLKGSIDTRIIMPYEKALGLSEFVATDMINDLKEKVKEVEIEIHLKKHMLTSEKLIEVSPLYRVENYKKIDKFTIDTDSQYAEITTEDNNTIIFENEIHLRTYDFKLSMVELSKMLKKAINENISVNIYKQGNHNVVFLYDDYKANKYKDDISLINKTLEVMEYRLPVDSKGNFSDRTLKTILNLVKIRDIETYNLLLPIANDPRRAIAILQMFDYANKHLYGFATKEQEVSYY